MTPKRVPATAEEKQDDKLINEFRNRYYRPRNLGLLAFTCAVKFQYDTLPAMVLVPAEVGGRASLEATKLSLVYTDRPHSPVLKRTYPDDISSITRFAYDKLFDLVQQFVVGFAQTWGAKAMGGPIPSDYTIYTSTISPSGYLFQLPAPDMTVEVTSNREFVVYQIVTKSPRERIEEHPSFTSTSQGLLITGNDADVVQGDARTHVHYELDYEPVDAFLLPHKIHLTVNDNIDVRFSFESCSVQKGIVLTVGPPPVP